MNLKNKKICLAGLAIILIVLFLFSASPALAASCGNSQEVLYLSSYFDSLFSFSEKIIKNFGFQISLAAAPDPDFCGSDSVGCSGTTPTATVSWTAAPFDIRVYLPGTPGVLSYVCYYILTVPGVGTYSIGNQYACDPDSNTTYYTISSGLNNSTTYNWSVEVYYGYSGGVQSWGGYGGSGQPYGSFATPNCVPPPGDLSLSLGGSGSASCNSVPLSWTTSSGATAYRILRGTPRVDISPYQPYTARNFTDTTVSQNTSYQYQIEAYNAGGTNRSNAINVSTPYCPPVINSFSCDPASIYQGQSSTCSWTSFYTTSCTASGAWSGSKPTSGSEVVVPLPPPSATYNLVCSGSGGSITQSITVNIAPLALPDWREIIPR